MRNLFSLLILLIFTSFKVIDRHLPEENKKAFRILVISDLNAGYGSIAYSPDVASVIAKIPELKPDLILCGGDMVAGQKMSLTEQNIREMWRSFNETVLKPIAKTKIPFGFTIGNHDASPNFTKERAIAKQFWTDEIKATNLDFVDSSNYPFYYSYTQQNVFFISWDASAAKIKPEVFDWMKKQLGSKTAKKSKLRILLGHLPLYAIVETKNKPGEVNSNPDSALTFFKENKIDLYISGHQHAYFPAHKEGIQLLNLGCIGDGPRPILGHSAGPKKAYTIITIPNASPKNFSYQTWMPTSNIELQLKD
jgi:predicted MPP superfamily phosphohydrolase